MVKATFRKYNEKTGKIERVREGKDNREKIFQCIYDNRTSGIRARDIIHNEKIGLSKEAVHNHLQVLLDEEERIYKKNRRYYPEISILNDFTIFSQHMREKSHVLFYKKLMEFSAESEVQPFGLEEYPRLELYQKVKIQLPEKISTLDDIAKSFPNLSRYFMKMLLGTILPEKYCRTYFGSKESLERCLFEFSNRIGAYITYIFLQALYPLKDRKISNMERAELSTTLINKSISLEDLFEILGISLCS